MSDYANQRNLSQEESEFVRAWKLRDRLYDHRTKLHGDFAQVILNKEQLTMLIDGLDRLYDPYWLEIGDHPASPNRRKSKRGEAPVGLRPLTQLEQP